MTKLSLSKFRAWTKKNQNSVTVFLLGSASTLGATVTIHLLQHSFAAGAHREFNALIFIIFSITILMLAVSGVFHKVTKLNDQADTNRASILEKINDLNAQARAGSNSILDQLKINHRIEADATSILEKLREIEYQISFNVRFHPCDDADKTIGTYRALREIIKGIPEDGNSEILLLNAFIEHYQELDGRAEAAREDYLRAIEAKFGKVNYLRILQIRQGTDLGRRFLPSSYRAHCENIINYKAKNKITVKLSLCSATYMYPLAFMVIRTRGTGNYLIWEVQRHLPPTTEEPDPRRYRVDGYMVIKDPARVITEEFYKLFNNAIYQHEPWQVHLSDFESKMEAEKIREAE
jgi:hypothetical protein